MSGFKKMLEDKIKHISNFQFSKMTITKAVNLSTGPNTAVHFQGNRPVIIFLNET